MRRPAPLHCRRSPRHPVRLSCQVVREADFRLVATHILDLSDAGMLVGPADAVLTGARLLASFELFGTGFWVDVEATVARVVHGRRPGERIRSLGLEFDRVPGFAEFLLRETLRSIPCNPPGFRPGRRRLPPLVPALLR